MPNTYIVSSYAVVDAAITLRAGHYRFQVNGYNLLDKNYVDSASPTGTASVLLGEPRTVRFSVGYSL